MAIETENFTQKALDRLLAKVISGAIEPSSRYILKDRQCPKLHVRANKNDLTIVWVQFGKDESGKSLTRSLGKYSQWKNQENWLAHLRSNISIKEHLAPPAPEIVDKPEPQKTINELFTRYFNSKKFEALKYGKGIKGQLKKHYLPEFGGREWNTIKRSDLSLWHETLTKAVSVVTANRVLTYHYGAINWIAQNEFNDDEFNYPRLQKSPEPRTQRLPLPDLQLRALWHATKAIHNQRAGVVIRLLILTGQREDAIAGLKWSELTVDKDNKCAWMHIPPARSKAGHAYDIPISPEAIKILAEYRDTTDVIFPTRKDKNGKQNYVALDNWIKAQCEPLMIDYMNEHGLTAKQKKLMPWCFHNIRKNYRNMLSVAGVDEYTAEEMIGHVTPFVTKTEGRYHTRERYPEKLLAMTNVNTKMMDLLEGDISFALEGEFSIEGAPLGENLSIFT